MNALAQVPAWFWVVLLVISALMGRMAWMIAAHAANVRARRYRPEHAMVPAVVIEAARTLAESEEHRVRYGSMILAEERALELAHEPTAAEVTASRALHGYIPELDPDIDAPMWQYEAARPETAEQMPQVFLPFADDLGPGAGMNAAGYNSHLPSGLTSVKVDSPAPDWPEWTGDPTDPEPLRPKRGPTLADLGTRCDAFMTIMRADHERWLASARERWAVA